MIRSEDAFLSAEQVVATIREPTDAALIDGWGRPHRLAAETNLGRSSDGDVICVFAPDISRTHAQITRCDASTWMIKDLASTNGTFVDNEIVVEPIELRDRCSLRLGGTSFYFLAHLEADECGSVSRSSSKTIRPPSESELSRSTLQSIRQREVSVAFEEPTGGGGAVMKIGDTHVQLTLAQFDLLRLLSDRMQDQRDHDEADRGYVAMDELLERLSFESFEASPSNVRQLVRRVRRVLLKAGLGELIESRHGRGYRLNVLPRRSGT